MGCTTVPGTLDNSSLLRFEADSIGLVGVTVMAEHLCPLQSHSEPWVWSQALRWGFDTEPADLKLVIPLP